MAGDPFYRWLHPADGPRTVWLCGFMTRLLRLLTAHGQVWVTGEDVRGVIGLLPPESKRFPLGASLGFAVRTLLASGGPPWRRLARGARTLRTLEGHLPAEPHWNIVIAGVHPDGHGQGLGRRVMEHALTLAGETTVHLETTNPANPPFYERFGFSVESVVRLGPDLPQAWTMIRRA